MDAYPLTSRFSFYCPGWAYENLQPHDNALDLANEIIGAYLNQTQGGESHSVPKTISLLNTESFNTLLGRRPADRLSSPQST